MKLFWQEKVKYTWKNCQQYNRKIVFSGKSKALHGKINDKLSSQGKKRHLQV
jgi:hypothetical protein